MLKTLLARRAKVATELKEATSLILHDPDYKAYFDVVEKRALDSTLPVEDRLEALWVRHDLLRLRREAMDQVESYMRTNMILYLLATKPFSSKALRTSLWRLLQQRIFTALGAVVLTGCGLYTVYGIYLDRPLIP